MALGGYLYKGYSVEKQSGWDDGQWALAIHKCRVKSFIDSCERSSCNWTVSRTSGDISLSSNDGYIYSLSTNSGNTSYRGYATYFKYKEQTDLSPQCYYLILTIPRWQCNATPGDSSSSHDGVDVYINNLYSCLYSSGSDSSECYFCNTSCFHAISLSDFGSHPKESNYIPTNSTRLTQIANINSSSYSDSSLPSLTSSEYSYIGSSAVSFGYSTKNGSPDIESFSKNGNDGSPSWHVTVLSPRLVSTCINSEDNYKLGLIKVYTNTGDSSSSEASNPYQDSLGYSCIQFLRSDGVLPSGVFAYKSPRSGDMLYNGSSYCSNASQRVYSPFLLYTNNPHGSDLPAKGHTNVELLCFSFQTATIFKTASNGKYLCVNYKSSFSRCNLLSDCDYESSYMYFYIGWDNDNPSMDTTSACQVYTP